MFVFNERGNTFDYFVFYFKVKPILKFSFNDKDLLTKNLSIIEQTSQRIRCKILSNPLISSKIEWFKNDQLMIGKRE